MTAATLMDPVVRVLTVTLILAALTRTDGALPPTVKWAQRPTMILLRVKGRYNVIFSEPNTLILQSDAREFEWTMEDNFVASVCESSKLNRETSITLRKETPKKWDRPFSKSNKTNPKPEIDWERWVDDDDEEEVAEEMGSQPGRGFDISLKFTSPSEGDTLQFASHNFTVKLTGPFQPDLHSLVVRVDPERFGEHAAQKIVEITDESKTNGGYQSFRIYGFGNGTHVVSAQVISKADQGGGYYQQFSKPVSVKYLTNLKWAALRIQSPEPGDVFTNSPNLLLEFDAINFKLPKDGFLAAKLDGAIVQVFSEMGTGKLAITNMTNGAHNVTLEAYDSNEHPRLLLDKEDASVNFEIDYRWDELDVKLVKPSLDAPATFNQKEGIALQFRAGPNILIPQHGYFQFIMDQTSDQDEFKTVNVSSFNYPMETGYHTVLVRYTDRNSLPISGNYTFDFEVLPGKDEAAAPKKIKVKMDHPEHGKEMLTGKPEMTVAQFIEAANASELYDLPIKNLRDEEGYKIGLKEKLGDVQEEGVLKVTVQFGPAAPPTPPEDAAGSEAGGQAKSEL